MTTKSRDGQGGPDREKVNGMPCLSCSSELTGRDYRPHVVVIEPPARPRGLGAGPISRDGRPGGSSAPRWAECNQTTSSLGSVAAHPGDRHRMAAAERQRALTLSTGDLSPNSPRGLQPAPGHRCRSMTGRNRENPAEMLRQTGGSPQDRMSESRSVGGAFGDDDSSQHGPRPDDHHRVHCGLGILSRPGARSWYATTRRKGSRAAPTVQPALAAAATSGRANAHADFRILESAGREHGRGKSCVGAGTAIRRRSPVVAAGAGTDARLLARGQLPRGGHDLPQGQSAAHAPSHDRRRQAPAAGALGSEPRTVVRVGASQPADRQARPRRRVRRRPGAWRARRVGPGLPRGHVLGDLSRQDRGCRRDAEVLQAVLLPRPHRQPRDARNPGVDP